MRALGAAGQEALAGRLIAANASILVARLALSAARAGAEVSVQGAHSTPDTLLPAALAGDSMPKGSSAPSANARLSASSIYAAHRPH